MLWEFSIVNEILCSGKVYVVWLQINEVFPPVVEKHVVLYWDSRSHTKSFYYCKKPSHVNSAKQKYFSIYVKPGKEENFIQHRIKRFFGSNVSGRFVRRAFYRLKRAHEKLVDFVSRCTWGQVRKRRRKLDQKAMSVNRGLMFPLKRVNENLHNMKK